MAGCSAVPFFVLQFRWKCAIIPFRCGCSSSVERQLPKLHRGVRLPSAAPARRKRHVACDEPFYFIHGSSRAHFAALLQPRFAVGFGCRAENRCLESVRTPPAGTGQGLPVPSFFAPAGAFAKSMLHFERNINHSLRESQAVIFCAYLKYSHDTKP